jgi:signal transduction histidine kinase/CheY-like chemotaxis protein
MLSRHRSVVLMLVFTLCYLGLALAITVFLNTVWRHHPAGLGFGFGLAAVLEGVVVAVLVRRLHELRRALSDLGVANDDLAQRVAERTSSLRASEERFRNVFERVEHDRLSADRQKDAFLAMLAHELRNPLAPIRSAVGVLRSRGDVEPVVVRCRDMIDRQVTHLARLLDDLLDVSRLSRGYLVLQSAPMSLRTAIDNAVETSRPAIDEHRHRLSVEWQVPDVELQGDATRLTQVFGNLLSNAAKYTPDGGRVEVVIARDAEHGQVAVTVKDSGVGVAANMTDRIFDLFAHADGSPGHQPGGLGVGLSLARRLVELHQGTLGVVSAGPGQGSEFIVRLPIALPAARQDGPLSNASADSTRSLRRRVLVADDNVDAADTLSLFLDSVGCDVRTVYGGEAAIQEAERFRPDVLLLDLGMAAVDGHAVWRRVREASWGQSMVAVAITGRGRDDDRVQSERAGFAAHLVKPVDTDVLVRLLDSFPDTESHESAGTSDVMAARFRRDVPDPARAGKSDKRRA